MTRTMVMMAEKTTGAARPVRGSSVHMRATSRAIHAAESGVSRLDAGRGVGGAAVLESLVVAAANTTFFLSEVDARVFFRGLACAEERVILADGYN
jgi:hypothetical protein